MVQPEALKKSVADAGMELLAGIGQRFLTFCDHFGDRFRQRTQTAETSVRHDVRGLLQAETKNMERIKEAIPEADHQALHHMNGDRCSDKIELTIRLRDHLKHLADDFIFANARLSNLKNSFFVQ